MSTRTRGRAAATLLGISALLALAATPVLAKNGAEIQLDTVVHRDAQPGSTIQIGWSAAQIVDDARYPLHGPLVVELVGPKGAATEATGTETPAGSGHYVASVIVPDGGIWSVSVALKGEACYGDGTCQPADYAFPLTDDPMVSGQPVGFSRPASPTTAAPAADSVSTGLLPLVAIGVACALGGGLAALVVARRRQIGAQPSGR